MQLFFVVSAFTLYLSHDNRRAEDHPTRNFFIRRICRIVPMFYVAAVIGFSLLPQWFGTIKEAWPSLILLHGISPQTIRYGPAGGWSVADEALFYLCLPLFFRWITDLRSALTAFCIAAPLCFLGARFLVKAFPGQSEFIWFLGFPIEIPIFLIGIVGYFVWREWIKGRRDRMLSSALLAAAVLLYFSFIPFNYGTLYGTSFTALLLLLSLSLYPWPALVNGPTRFLGRVSYSIYLIHFVVIHQVQGWIDLHGLSWQPATRVAASFAVTLLLTTPLAYCSWRWVEEPGIRLGRILIARLESKVLRPA